LSAPTGPARLTESSIDVGSLCARDAELTWSG